MHCCCTQEAKNERLWFKTNLKLCGLWFKLKEYGRAQKILRELHKCGGEAAHTHRLPAAVHTLLCSSNYSLDWLPL